MSLHKLINALIKAYCIKYNISTIFSQDKITQIKFAINEDCNFLKMFINLNDKGLSKELICFKTRELENIIALQEFVKDHSDNIDYIIDIGANIGFFVLLEDFLSKNKTILALEPVKENFEILKKNIETFSSGLNKIEMLNIAAGQEDKLIDFYVHSLKNWSSINPPKNLKKKMNKIQVQSVNFSKFLKRRNINKNVFIRMDIEGFEYNLFRNLEDWLKTAQNVFFNIEVHAHIMQENTFRLLDIWKKSNLKIERVVYSLPSIYNFFMCRNKTLYKLHKASGKKLFSDIINTVNSIKSWNDLEDFIKQNKLGFHIFLKKE